MGIGVGWRVVLGDEQEVGPRKGQRLWEVAPPRPAPVLSDGWYVQPMLSTQDIQAHLKRITYKPGWTITAYDGRWEGQHVVVRTEVEDTYNPGTTTTLDVHSMLPPMRDTQTLEEWVAWRLQRLECHEMREFLKRDGQPIYDPHAEHADRDLT